MDVLKTSCERYCNQSFLLSLSGTPTVMEKGTGTGRAILFVEEEDTDDIEGYNLEDDFICPDLTYCSSRVSHISYDILYMSESRQKISKR